MTTQVPYGPAGAVAEPQPPAAPQHPPAPTYPTAPPWAATPPAEPAEEPQPIRRPGTVYGAEPLEHGQLLVPFPEEMNTAARNKAPAWWPVAVLSMLTPLPGLISAIRRSGQARRGRNSRAPYWLAFVLGLAVSLGVGYAARPAAVDAWHDFRERAYTQALQDHLVKDGQLNKAARVTATSARCEAASARGGDDERRYTCLLALDDGRTGTLDVTADSAGNWTAVPLKK